MVVYYGMIITVVVLGLMAQFVNERSMPTEIVSSDGFVRYKNHYGFFYPLLFFAFVFVGGFRYYVGTDLYKSVAPQESINGEKILIRILCI